ncbi:MAG: SAM-dependent methyltransferase [Pseudomonadota bacterium]
MSKTAAAQETTGLQTRLAALIRASGPMSVADFMADALGNPQDGYYTSHCPIGEDGDFTTAPEISQMFGELIGAWLMQSWADIGEPSLFNLIELGPGRGALMADILRTAKIRPAFLAAARPHLIETSGRLRMEQMKRFEETTIPIKWAAKLSEVPPAPTLIVANEMVDCLPIRQFVRTNAGWCERMVGLKDPEADELVFQLSPVPLRAEHVLPAHVRDAPQGSVFETCAPAAALAEEIAHRLQDFKGRALIIDYGHARSGLGDTLQAVRDHGFWPPLATPGKADLTAHVDFEALAKAALTGGGIAYGPVSQGVFLKRLGLDARAGVLKRDASPEDGDAIDVAARRLASEEEMGAMFKVLCISSPGVAPPPGFEFP